ncbi:hypothetical protein H6G88_03605 [Bifidobacterium ruminantium]|uniref:hypothetical protein n=1 Tax=Bifidobacterium ruminantium TaxID=78346 RepID=UPI001958BF4D|nr:hypothetical protein [Bifidobacterium ruminantium]MBM6746390.1 hypothetical protein [Bifidobacterium ruminantium]
MHDFSQWLQSADGMDWTPILIAGILISLAIAVTCESVMAIFAALACACSLAGLPSYTLKSEIEQVWGLQEVSSECDLPDRELPTRNMKCYVTNGKGHKELVEIRVSKDGTKLGLYDTDGKALKQTGRE